jgi:hypothetical protein
MGYLHINNLYKDQRVLKFSKLWALEKVHGTSAHIKFNLETGVLTFFSGGESYNNFTKLFDADGLKEKLAALFTERKGEVVIYGEAYGGKQQKMAHTYGDKLCFIAFDVAMNEKWLNVPEADALVKQLGLEFVPYRLIGNSMEEIDAERNKPSEIAVRRGITESKIKEGVVLRPEEEAVDEYGDRIIAKHKNAEFSETKTVKPVDNSKLEVLEKAKAIATEWVTMERLKHVLDKLPEAKEMKHVPIVNKAMVADVYREAKGEIVESKEAEKEISTLTAKMFKQYLNDALKGLQ